MTPIDMLLFCPACKAQHIDAPGEDWSNPPHATHKCAYCGLLWRPSNSPTNGVRMIDVNEPQHAERISNSFPPDGRLKKPAQVGNTLFGIGVNEYSVIERAQREAVYQQRPEFEAVRINAANRLLRLFHMEGVLAELVTLKGMKEALDDHRAGRARLDDFERLEAEYAERKPRAWERARELLQGFRKDGDIPF